MVTTLMRRVLRMSPLYHPLKRFLDERRQRAQLAAWKRAGQPMPPPQIVKRLALLDYAAEYGLRSLVETGTYRGDMVENTRRQFDRVYSIELSPDLHAQARQRFARVANVELIQGDSARQIPILLERLTEPALFWLDGHYSSGETARGSKDTPVMDELVHVLARQQRDVIVIDDARCFGRDADYPTIETLREFVRSKRPDLTVVVQDDMIRIVPPRR